jgi:putative membrane protein
MNASLLLFLLLAAASLLGLLLGTLTGLVPGFHPNNVAVILLSFTPLLLAEPHGLTASLPAEWIPLSMAAVILAASVAHTFLNFIPAAFIGAPEEDTALALLPAHQLLLEGRAYEATVLSAIGSFGAVICSSVLFIPFYLLFASLHLYELLRGSIFYLLLAISVLLILTESFSERMEPYKAILLSSSVFLLAGIFGLVILNLPYRAPLPLQSTLLFPALTGLFGLATILFAVLHTPELPKQRIVEPSIDRTRMLKSVSSGSIFGMLVSFLPGITTAHATVLAMLARRSRDPEQVIVTLSSVNTADVIFCLETLFLIARARSGTTIAISRLLDLQLWDRFTLPPTSLLYLLIVIFVTVPFSYFITRYLGKQFALHFLSLPYRTVLLGIALFLMILVFLFTGLIGLLTLLVGTCIGLIPIVFGIRRSTAMGVLLLPILVMLWQT